MRAVYVLLGFAVVVQSLDGQSSRDSWDAKFHPQAVQQRKEQRNQQWLDSWKDRPITATDVKQYWLMTLTQPMPDSLDASFNAVGRQNAALKAALESTMYDFTAQDIADQINILRLRQSGLVAEATNLEEERQARIRAHHQEELHKEIIARQNAMYQQLTEQISRLREDVREAKAAAESHY